MKKVSFIIPHFTTFEWTAVCVNALRKYGVPVDSEIIICDNSPGHPSIRAITETSLGRGVKVIQGMPEFPSHGMGYDLAFAQSAGDWVFTCETDSFPTRHGWFDEYVKASAKHDLIGPLVPQSAGHYIHPAGALVRRGVIEAAQKWQREMKDWHFIPGAAIEMGLSEKAYHVVANSEIVRAIPVLLETAAQMRLWEKAGAWQEMRSFDEDSFDTYSQRRGITNFSPVPGKETYLKIGYEAGQWLHYFAKHRGFRCLEAPSHIEWMPGHEGGQAAFSTIFGGFTHVWCGTVSNQKNYIADDVRAYKLETMGRYFSELDPHLQKDILAIKNETGLL